MSLTCPESPKSFRSTSPAVPITKQALNITCLICPCRRSPDAEVFLGEGSEDDRDRHEDDRLLEPVAPRVRELWAALFLHRTGTAGCRSGRFRSTPRRSRRARATGPLATGVRRAGTTDAAHGQYAE